MIDYLHRTRITHQPQELRDTTPPPFTSSLDTHTTYTEATMSSQRAQLCTHVQGRAHTHQPYSQEALKEEEAGLGIFMHVYI